MFQRWLSSSKTTHTAVPHVRSLAGWTPGLRTLLRGAVLPCGCLTGVYETWRGSVLCIVDSADTQCQTAGHDTDAILWQQTPTRLSTPVPSALR